jgi:hypothetical protein
MTSFGACSFICDIHLSFYYNRTTYVIEGFRVRDGVGQNDAVCTLVIGLGDVSIPLLPCRVPDLELEPVVIDSDGLDLKVDSYSRHVVLFKFVVGKSHQNVCLPHPTVPDYYQFQQVL